MKYGCFNRPFDRDICRYHELGVKERMDPKCRGCKHQKKQFRLMLDKQELKENWYERWKKD